MLNGRAGGALFVLGVVAPTLNHEIGNDSVKNGAVVVLIPHVLKEVGHCFGRFVGVQLHHDLAHIGGDFDFGRLLRMAQQRHEGHAQRQSQCAAISCKVSANSIWIHGISAQRGCWLWWWWMQQVQARAAGRALVARLWLWHRLAGPWPCTNRLNFDVQFCNWAGLEWPR